MPPSNIDLKRVVKQTFSHPNGINRPLLPSTAKVVGIAKGNEGIALASTDIANARAQFTGRAQSLRVFSR